MSESKIVKSSEKKYNEYLEGYYFQVSIEFIGRSIVILSAKDVSVDAPLNFSDKKIKNSSLMKLVAKYDKSVEDLKKSRVSFKLEKLAYGQLKNDLYELIKQ
jgi:hypothetical protein